MIWSARKQYYLGFWAFLELKSVNILIKMGLYFRHSVDIISTCYVYENRRKWLRSRTCNFLKNFDDLYLHVIKSISPKASVENSSAQWAILLRVTMWTTLCPKQWVRILAVGLDFASGSGLPVGLDMKTPWARLPAVSCDTHNHGIIALPWQWNGKGLKWWWKLLFQAEFYIYPPTSASQLKIEMHSKLHIIKKYIYIHDLPEVVKCWFLWKSNCEKQCKWLMERLLQL